ncbi:MAG: hypothetical protein KKE44_26195 [Proteobacteria bacterium]|nr:hypothetical protein [Pseudomonadota bacterium]MBU1586223.1 hypothetical protein [Pseudomonadota bacterium]MBU2452692.1 hypothetical protein [Pseudomonadota bacterium]
MVNHVWTVKDDIIAFFLYKFGSDDLIFGIDAIASKLGISKDSLIARKENFKFLETGIGLSHVAEQSKQIHAQFKDVYLGVIKEILYSNRNKN